MRTEDVVLNGKMVGQLVNGKLYLSHRRKSKHLYRAMDAWGVDHSLLELLKARGCKLLVVNDREGGWAYYTNLSDFEAKAVFLDHGHGLQKFLPRREFRKGRLGEILEAMGRVA